MAENVLNTAEKKEIEAAIEIAEELYCDGKSDECDAAFQALLDKYTQPKEQIHIIKRWNECLKAIYNDLIEKLRYGEALELCSKALLFLGKYPVELNDELLSMQNDYANCLKHMDKQEQAIKIYKELIIKCTAKYGKGANNTLISFGNLAGSLKDTGKLPAAIQMRTCAVNGLLQLHGKKNRDYMRELSNLSDDYSLLGNMQKAINLESQVYKLRKKNLGKHNIYTIDSPNIIASFYRTMMQYSKAIFFYKKARSLTLVDDYYTLTSAIMLAKCYACIDQNEKAQQTLNSLSKKSANAN